MSSTICHGKIGVNWDTQDLYPKNRLRKTSETKHISSNHYAQPVLKICYLFDYNIYFDCIVLLYRHNKQYCIEDHSFTLTSSLVWWSWCGRTSSFCSLLLLGGVWHSTYGRSSCRSCTFEPTHGEMVQWHHHEGEEPSEGLIPSGCYSPKGFGHLPVAYQRR